MDISFSDYPVPTVEGLPSPRLLVFREKVEANINRMRELIASVAPDTGFEHLRTHVKTNKSSWATRLLLDHGITRFKATPNELDMLLDSGARDILVAYPLLQYEATRFARRVADFPDVRLLAHVAHRRHIEDLGTAARAHGVVIDCLIDCDVGQHRSGAPLAAVPDIARVLDESPTLRFVGLHAYDGHIKGATDSERRILSEHTMHAFTQTIEVLEKEGTALELIVAGGTPAFLADLDILRSAVPHRTKVEVSPGTWIYWDTNYDNRMPGLFQPAALILAHVMDRPGDDLVALDLGYKRWAIDAGPVEVFSVPGVEVVFANEEHTVLRISDASRAAALEVGSPVLIVPRHVCSTVNLWETFTVVGPGGEVEVENAPVDGRNR